MVDQLVLKMWASRKRCVMCKHKEPESHLLPVEVVRPGKLQPNFNPAWLFHYTDTHGLPVDLVAVWITSTVYDWPLFEYGWAREV